MTQNPENLATLIANLKVQQAIRSQPFPLTNLLQLYSISSRSLYLNHFEGLKELIAWLSPISRSEKQSIYVPTYLLTYEINEIAKILGEHPSQIYQELTQIWKDSIGQALT